MADIPICSIDECDKPVKIKSHGLCDMHYKRIWRHGSFDCLITPKHGKTRFFNEIVMTFAGADCLVWPYPVGKRGRPHMNYGGRTVSVTRMICERKYGQPPSGIHQAAHSCGKGDKGCVNPLHLRWATPKENMADQVVHGTRIGGEKHPSAKLTKKTAGEIRSMHGKMTRPEMAAKYQVHLSTIGRVLSGQRWAHSDDKRCLPWMPTRKPERA